MPLVQKLNTSHWVFELLQFLQIFGPLVVVVDVQYTIIPIAEVIGEQKGTYILPVLGLGCACQ